MQCLLCKYAAATEIVSRALLDAHAIAALTLSGGTQTADGSSSVTGAGQLAVSGGTITLAGRVKERACAVQTTGTLFFRCPFIQTHTTTVLSGWIDYLHGTYLSSPPLRD